MHSIDLKVKTLLLSHFRNKFTLNIECRTKTIDTTKIELDHTHIVQEVPCIA